MKITSRSNETVKNLVKLKQKKHREATQTLLVEGEHLVGEAEQAGLLLKTIGLHADFDLQITEVIAEKLSETQSGSSVFALIRKPEAKPLNGTRFLLCDGIQDPGNLGTIIRTAHSFGFDGIVLSPDCVDAYNDKVIRASQGSIFYINVLRMPILEALQAFRNMNIQTYATHLSDDTIGLEAIVHDRVAVVLGSEGAGVSEAVLKAVNATVKIETSQFESLNVAVAAGIICYALRK